MIVIIIINLCGWFEIRRFIYILTSSIEIPCVILRINNFLINFGVNTFWHALQRGTRCRRTALLLIQFRLILFKKFINFSFDFICFFQYPVLKIWRSVYIFILRTFIAFSWWCVIILSLLLKLFIYCIYFFMLCLFVIIRVIIY